MAWPTENVTTIYSSIDGMSSATRIPHVTTSYSSQAMSRHDSNSIHSVADLHSSSDSEEEEDKITTEPSPFPNFSPKPSQLPYFHAYRWCLLTSLAFSVTGSFYAFDLPGQLNRTLAILFQYPSEAWQTPFSQLYAIYAFPNILMPFLIGRAVDIHGTIRDETFSL